MNLMLRPMSTTYLRLLMRTCAKVSNIGVFRNNVQQKKKNRQVSSVEMSSFAIWLMPRPWLRSFFFSPVTKQPGLNYLIHQIFCFLFIFFCFISIIRFCPELKSVIHVGVLQNRSQKWKSGEEKKKKQKSYNILLMFFI